MSVLVNDPNGQAPYDVVQRGANNLMLDVSENATLNANRTYRLSVIDDDTCTASESAQLLLQGPW